MKVSDYVAKFLHARGVSCVFQLPGGMISHLLDSLARVDGLRVVTVHHEQAAAFAADAIGRLTGAPGVALATVGPGALNLVNGIASAFFDSSPALFITGQVQTYLQRGNRPVRQFGFQECDFVEVVKPLCKAAWRITRAQEVPDRLAQGLALACQGRPGPVVIDIPMDIQAQEVSAVVEPAGSTSDCESPGGTPAGLPAGRGASPVGSIDSAPGAPGAPDVPAVPPAAALSDLLAALAQARRPLLLAGGGVRAGQARELLARFARRVQVPLVATVMALDVLSAGDPLRVGLVGMYGNRWANLAMLESDVLLVLGSRLDAGVTSADVTSWKRGKKIFQIDIDAGELGIRTRGITTLHADLRPSLEALLAAAPDGEAPGRAEWLARIDELRRRWPDTAELDGYGGINPNRFVAELSRASAAAAAFVSDAGQHTWWTTQSIRLSPGQRFLCGTGLGSMGFALPAAIGAAFALGRPIVVCVGDGALQLNIQELQTVARHRLPLKIAVFHNGCHGMVRQFQEEAFARRYPATVDGYDAPDFERVAAAYGLAARSIADAAEVASGVEWLWRDPDAPALLQVRLPLETNVYPYVPFGRPLSAMESFPRRQPGKAE